MTNLQGKKLKFNLKINQKKVTSQKLTKINKNQVQVKFQFLGDLQEI